MNHHKYSPSSLERRSLCPYSVHEVEYPDKENTSALEGTLLHEATYNPYIRKSLNLEQRNLIAKCLKFKRSFHSQISFVETHVSAIYDNKTLYSGTPDVVILDKDKAIVIDWKFGYLEVDEPKNNLQLAAYSAAVMQYCNKEMCDTYIYQPRISNTAKKYTFTNSESIIKYIRKIIDRCEEPNPACIPGEKQCRFCKLKDNMACPALKNELQTIDKTINLPELNDTDLVSLYERGKVVDKFIKAINDEIKLRIEEKGYCGDRIYKETRGGFEITSVPEAWEKVKNIIKKEDFLKICCVSDIALKELYCYNRVELNKKDAENEYYNTIGSVRQEKTKRKTVVKKEL